MQLKECLKKRSNDYNELNRLFYEKRGENIYEELAQKNALESEEISVSIIIPCHNSEGTLEVLLNSIKNQSFDKGNMEVIVVDDASTDDSYKLLEAYLPHCEFESTLLRHRQNLGRATARNSGAYLARNDILVFLDSDVIIPAHFIYSHATKHRMVDNIDRSRG